MVIEQPGEYRTRDGRKAVVLGYNPYGTPFRRWIGYVSEYTSEWSDDGSYQPGGSSDRDLIGPWEDSSALGALVEQYLDQRGLAEPEVTTLDNLLRAIAAEIAALKARR